MEQQSSESKGMQFTTNTHDLEEAAKLRDRLSNQADNAAVTKIDGGGDSCSIPLVSIDEGAYKYVLMSATAPKPIKNGDKELFVYSKRGAAYHRNVAEFLLPQLESGGYRDIQILGGGRILRDDDEKKISIFGYSYGFGRADHSISKHVVEKSEKFKGYEITWSNSGY